MRRPKLNPLRRTHIGLRVDLRAKPHELGGRGGAALDSSAHEWSHANLQHAQCPRSATMRRPKHNSLTRTHIGLRVDVRGKPHELGDHGGVAVGSRVHERSHATLQHAQRPRSATMSRLQLRPVTRNGGGESRSDAHRATERGTIMQIMAEHRHRERLPTAISRRGYTPLARAHASAIARDRGGVTNR
jgi:hypothetical protein